MITRPGRPRRDVLAAMLTAGAAAMSGPLVGLVWWCLAPRVALTKVADGQFSYADPTPEQAVAADGWFGLLGIGAGVLAGVFAWLALRRRRGPAVLVGLAVGCLAAAVLASWVGHTLSFADFREASQAAAVGGRLDGPLLLRVRGLSSSELDQHWRPTLVGVIPLQALVAVFGYTLLAGFSAHSTLRSAPRVAAEPEPDGLAPPWQSWPAPGRSQPAEPASGWSIPAGPASGATSPGEPGADQFGLGRTGSSDGATGTART